LQCQSSSATALVAVKALSSSSCPHVTTFDMHADYWRENLLAVLEKVT
jgi:hypothetical protein